MSNLDLKNVILSGVLPAFTERAPEAVTVAPLIDATVLPLSIPLMKMRSPTLLFAMAAVVVKLEGLEVAAAVAL
jgi:hypothetical protein